MRIRLNGVKEGIPLSLHLSVPFTCCVFGCCCLVVVSPPLFFLEAFFCPLLGSHCKASAKGHGFTGVSFSYRKAQGTDYRARTPAAEGDFDIKESPEGTGTAGDEDKEVGSRARRHRRGGFL